MNTYKITFVNVHDEAVVIYTVHEDDTNDAYVAAMVKAEADGLTIQGGWLLIHIEIVD